MVISPDRILIVESDPVISDLLGRQTLQAAGYQVQVVSDMTSAIASAIKFNPDVILTDIALPDMSSKDLLVALSSQGISIPVILLAPRGREAEVIQTFRLGAADYLTLPVREAEVLATVERSLRSAHERKERARLDEKLQQTNQELQQRVRELTTIFSVGKAVTSITDQSLLFNRILESALRAAQAEIGWFLLRDDSIKAYRLTAHRNLPPSLAANLNQPWDDGISSLVGMSAQTLTIHGDALLRFKISSICKSAIIVPVKAQKQVIGLLTLVRREVKPFSASDQHLLEAMADYVAISLVNASLFRNIEERARSQQILAENSQIGEVISNELLTKIKTELRIALENARASLTRLVQDPTARWNTTQRQDLTALQQEIILLSRLAEAITPLPVSGAAALKPSVNLNEVIRDGVTLFTPFAQQNEINISVSLPDKPVIAQVESDQFRQILGGLLSNAIRLSNPGGQVYLVVEMNNGHEAHLSVRDSGPGMDPTLAAALMEGKSQSQTRTSRRFGGLGIGLRLMKELVTRNNGKIWVENAAGQGAIFHVSFPGIS